MKKVFIESRYTGKVNIGKIKIDELPEKVGLVTTVQFVDLLEEVKEYLEENGKKVFVGKGNQPYSGQLLGCDPGSAEKIDCDIDCFLYIGDGRFHPTAVAYNLNKKVYCFDPKTNNFSKISTKEVNEYKKKKKVKLVKFLSADSIGVIVSTKKGQQNFLKAKKLKRKLENEKKEVFLFVTETLNISELENFPFIKMWVNTACPRIEEDHKDIINLRDVLI